MESRVPISGATHSHSSGLALWLGLVLACASSACADTILTNLTQPALVAALAQGGVVRINQSGSLTLSNTISIANQVSLDASTNTVTLSGNKTFRLFTVLPNARLSLAGLTLTGGQSTNGGALYVNAGATVILTNCTLTGNSASTGLTNDSRVGSVTTVVLTNGVTSVTAITNSTTTDTNLFTGIINSNINSSTLIFSNNLLGTTIVIPTNNISGSNFSAFTTNLVFTNIVTETTNFVLSEFSILLSQFVNGTNTLSDTVTTIESDTFLITNLFVPANVAVAVPGADGKPGADRSYGVGGNGGSGVAGRACAGGAVFNRGNLQVFNCTLATNSVTGGGGGNGGDGGAGPYRGGNGGSGGKGNSGLGGALYNDKPGTVLLRNSTFDGNTAAGGRGGSGGTGGGGAFGGLLGSGGPGGPAHGVALYSLGHATVVGCTFSSNRGTGGDSAAGGTLPNGSGGPGPHGGDSFGGALYSAGPCAVTNCTFLANLAVGGGGGDGGPGQYRAGKGGSGGTGTGGAVYSASTAYLINCTVWENGAQGGANGLAGSAPFSSVDGSPGASHGGGLARRGGTFVVANSIVGGSAPGRDAYGAMTDKGFNLWSDTSIRPARRSTSRNATNPQLGPFGFYGGPTLTIPLLTNSPARDKIPPASAPAADQRGIPRPVNSLSDIGAYEYEAAGPPVVLRSPRDLEALQGTTASLNAIVSGAGPLSFQWFWHGIVVASGTTNYSGILTNTLMLTNVQPIQAGDYQVVVANALGSATSSVAHLTVDAFAFITVQPQSLTNLLGTPVSFGVGAVGDSPLTYQWQFNGTNLPAQTQSVLSLASVRPADAGTYQVVVSNSFGTMLSSNATLAVVPVFAWGTNGFGQTNVPGTAGSVVAVAAGQFHVLALNADGSVLAWGAGMTNTGFRPESGQSVVPAGVANATAIAAGGFHSLALARDGSVTAWGDNSFGQTTVPTGLNGVVAVAAGLNHSLALKGDGTVVAWGANLSGQTSVPASLGTNVTAVAAGDYHNLALMGDGSIIAWGSNSDGQTNVPPGLANVVAVAAGGNYSLALKADGTVVAWGNNQFHQTDVPAAASNVVALAAGPDHALALKSDGRLIAWGDNTYGQASIPPVLANVVGVAAGKQFNVVLVNDGSPLILQQPASLTANQGSDAVFSVAARSPTPLTYQWRFNAANIGGATNSTLLVASVTATNAGSYSVSVANLAGTVVSSNAILTVLMPPSIISLVPTNQIVEVGSTVSFRVSATGFALAYQWAFDNAAIPGATTSVLIRENVQISDSGSYSVVVTNVLGSASTNALLTVNPPPPALAQSTAQRSPAGTHPAAALVPQISGGGFSFRFPSRADLTYIVEFKDSLAATNWIPLGAPFTGTGGWLTNTDPAPNPSSRFYRLRVR